MPDQPNRKLPLGCQMPPTGRAKGTTWLEIHEGSGGFFLYQFTEKDAPPKWDSFYGDVDDIFQDCQRIWGIARCAWEPLGG